GLACLIFSGFFGATLTWTVSRLATRTDIAITQCVFIAGAALSLWQLLALIRRARGKSLTEGEPQACAVFYRAELERQRSSYGRSAMWVPLAFSAVWVPALLLMQPFRVIMIVIWILFVPVWVYQR